MGTSKKTMPQNVVNLAAWKAKHPERLVVPVLKNQSAEVSFLPFCDMNKIQASIAKIQKLIAETEATEQNLANDK